MAHNEARPLVGREWGFNWLELIPPEFRSALKYKTTRIPGVDNSTLPDEPTGLVITSKTVTDRINEIEKTTVELDSVLNLPITTQNHEIVYNYGGAEVDVVMVISDNPADISVGQGVQWIESYSKTLSTTLGISFTVGKRLTHAYVDEVVILNGGTGYVNGTHAGTLTGGGGTGATFNFTVVGGVITSTVMTNRGDGYIDRPTVGGLGAGTGANLVAILGGWPTLIEEDFDEEMRVDKIITRRVVDPIYPVDPAGANVPDGYIYEIKPIDKWHSWLEITHRTPTAVSSATAVVNFEFRPYKFPGTLDYTVARPSNAWLGYRSAKADLIQTRVKTWWVISSTVPTVTVDQIISDTVVVMGVDRIERYSDVLHDAFTTTVFGTTSGGVFWGAAQSYPATTPTFTQYYKGTPTGSVAHNAIAVVNGGSGYALGNTIFIPAAFGGTFAQITVTGVGYGNSISAFTIVNEDVGATFTNPVTATGGSGSGATFNVTPYSEIVYNPATAWVGTERIIGASVKQEKEKNLWKVETYSVVMR